MMPQDMGHLLSLVPSSITHGAGVTESLDLQVRVVNNILGLLMNVAHQELRQ